MPIAMSKVSHPSSLRYVAEYLVAIDRMGLLRQSVGDSIKIAKSMFHECHFHR
jgi:hypothetical protein